MNDIVVNDNIQHNKKRKKNATIIVQVNWHIKKLINSTKLLLLLIIVTNHLKKLRLQITYLELGYTDSFLFFFFLVRL